MIIKNMVIKIYSQSAVFIVKYLEKFVVLLKK